MTSSRASKDKDGPMTPEERAAEAHREAFALITTALHNPGGYDFEPELIDRANSTSNPAQAVLDMCQTLIWHAAGAIVTHSGSSEAAIELVRVAALEQEMKHG